MSVELKFFNFSLFQMDFVKIKYYNFCTRLHLNNQRDNCCSSISFQKCWDNILAKPAQFSALLVS